VRGRPATWPRRRWGSRGCAPARRPVVRPHVHHPHHVAAAAACTETRIIYRSPFLFFIAKSQNQNGYASNSIPIKPQSVLSLLTRFLVVKLTHLALNSRFDICVVFTTNYFLMGGDIHIDNETLLVIDFVNLNIKSAQPFRYAHINRIYICLFIEVNAHKCTVF
jgi:hypothetical protein